MAMKHSTWHEGSAVKLWIAPLLGFGLALVIGCNPDRGGGSADGATVFQNVCATCHGPTGKPTETMVQRLGVRDLTSAELRARVTPALVEAQVRNGSKNKLMPAFAGALSDAQISAVAQYVASPQFLAH